MASLTPLSKVLIGLAVVGAMASAVWHLGLKERLGSGAAPAADSSRPATPTPPTPPSPAPPSQQTAPAAPAAAPVAATPLPPSTPATGGPATASRLSTAESAELGRKLLDSGDFAQARVHLEQAIKGGDGGAACHLGEMTLKGQGGIAANQERSATLFQLAQSRGVICFTAAK